MFQTKKQLKERIKLLEGRLEREKSINAISESNGLKKCDGVICKSCEHGVFITEPPIGQRRLIGCDLNVSCPSYKKINS